MLYQQHHHFLYVQMLIWNSWGAISFKGGAFWLDNFFVSNLSVFIIDFYLLKTFILEEFFILGFHFHIQSPGQSISFFDFALLILSTLISIAFHEFGHAIAAARSLSL